jgi:hypothetical protein
MNGKIEHWSATPADLWRFLSRESNRASPPGGISA